MNKLWRNWFKNLKKLDYTFIFLGHISFVFTSSATVDTTEIPQLINYQRLSMPAFNQVWSVDQAPSQFLYFGTSGGLLEYNGTAWSTYVLPNGTILRSVSVDEQGRIFTGGFEEFGFWETDTEKGLIYRSLTDLVAEDQLANEQIWNIIQSGKDVFFQSFARIFKYTNHKIEVIYPPANIMFGRQINEQLYFPCLEDGLFTLQEDNHFEFVEGSERFYQIKIELLIPLGGEKLLVGTKNDGLYVKQKNTFVPFNTQLNKKLSEYQLNKGIQLSNGDLALGTVLNGVYIVDKTGRIKHHYNRKNSLQNNTILALEEDHLGNLWIGTDNGIDMIMLRSPLRFCRDQLGEIGTVYAAAKYERDLYLGTNQGVFRKKDRSTAFTLVEGTQGQVWDLKVIAGQLICGHNLGTFMINPDGDAELISKITGGYTLLALPNKGDLFIQGTYTGLVLFRLNEAGQLLLYKKIAGFNEPAKYLAFDNHGSLWVAHSNRGLFRLQLNADMDSLVNAVEYTQSEGLPMEYKLRVMDYKEKILVKSGALFLYYDEIKDRFASVQEDFFNSESDNFMLLPGKAEEYFKVFDNRVEWTRQDTLRRNFNITLVPGDPFILTQDSSYLFCIQNGYASLSQASLDRGETKGHSKTWVTSIVTPDRTIFLQKKNKQVITLKPGERDMDIYFTNTSFGQLKNYCIRLNGYNTEWQSTQSQPFMRFTNLEGGTYELIARSSDNTEEGAILNFEIQLHWYETIWGKAGMVFAFLSLVYLLYRWHRYRLVQIDRQKEKQLQEERIRNNNELLKIELDSKRKELANSAINLVRKNELLMEMREKLQALRKEHRDIERSTAYKSLIKLIDQSRSSEQDLALFDESFEEIHDSFYKKLKDDFSDLTPGDLRLAAYLKMNLTSKEIAPLLNISVRGVENKRYRLRKKLNLSADDNLTEFIMQL